MKKIFLSLVIAAFIVGGFSLPGFAQEQRTKNFALVVDQSGEMQETYHNDSKHRIARDIAKLFLEKVPRDLPIQGSIYMYGIVAAEDKNQFIRVQGWTNFKQGVFHEQFNKEIAPQMGPPVLSVVLREMRKDMGENNIKGRPSIIIISGGSLTDPGDPVKEAKNMADAYKNVCFYTVLVGKSQLGGKRLKEINQVGAHCGIRTTGDDVDNDKGMQRFVKHIFYKKTDKDDDNDGVPNKDDKCPNTPVGANVDYRGCWVLNDINFDVNKWDIKPMYFNQLDEIAAVMNANPDLIVTIEGHTDSDGDDKSNQTLSEKRANAVKEYLVSQGDVPGNRLTVVGKGENEPVADNSTKEGKAQNRRIEFRVTGGGQNAGD